MGASVQEFTVHPKELDWKSPAFGGFQYNLGAEHEWRGCKRSKWHEVGKSNKSYLKIAFPCKSSGRGSQTQHCRVLAKLSFVRSCSVRERWWEQVMLILPRRDDEQRDGKFNIALISPSAFLLLVKSTLLPSPLCCLIPFCNLTVEITKDQRHSGPRYDQQPSTLSWKSQSLQFPSLRHRLAHLFMHKCTIDIQRRLSKLYCWNLQILAKSTLQTRDQ